jgi:O-acetyl-ADP-ribose deacetylase (regulator of RNase III)
MQEHQILNKIEIVEGDITQQKVDVIVNAANESLIAGGGVSGAIHRAAGLGLEEECIKLGICNEGEAKITQAYNLPAKWVIHTVGPVWEGGNYDEEKILRNCYSNSLKLAKSQGVKTIAFPAISAGIYEFPLDKATSIAISEVKLFLEQDNSIEKVIFVCFERQVYNVYLEHLRQAFRLTELSESPHDKLKQ